MSWLSIIPDLIGMAREAITDEDKKTEMVGKLNTLQSNLYLAELDTKTHPVLDGIHKLGRQFLSFYTASLSAYLLYTQPDINPASLAMLAGPAGAYTIMKGRGK